MKNFNIAIRPRKIADIKIFYGFFMRKKKASVAVGASIAPAAIAVKCELIPNKQRYIFSVPRAVKCERKHGAIKMRFGVLLLPQNTVHLDFLNFINISFISKLCFASRLKIKCDLAPEVPPSLKQKYYEFF